MYNFSLLGLMLFAASAVAAALAPSKKTPARHFPYFDGHLTFSTLQFVYDVTCRFPNPSDAIDCSWTETRGRNVSPFPQSSTSAVGDIDSFTYINPQFTGTLTTSPSMEDDLFPQ